SGAAVGAAGSGASRNLVPGGGGKFPFLQPQGVSLRRSGRGGRRIQGGGAYQVYGAYLSPGLCAVPSCCRRKDRVPTRIFRSSACGQGAGHADSWSRILRTSGDGSEVSSVRKTKRCRASFLRASRRTPDGPPLAADPSHAPPLLS